MSQKNKMVFDYNFHDLLRVRIILEKATICDSYLNKIFDHYRISQAVEPDLCIHIGDFIPDLKGRFLVDGKYYVKDGSIFYENRHKFARWSVGVDGLESKLTKVRINSNLAGRVVFPGETIYSFIRFKLARMGYPLVHGSGVGSQGKGYVFSARGGTGKTITAINLVRKGFDFYSDDSVILGNREFFSFIVPFNLRFTYDVEKLLGIHFSREVRTELLAKKILHYLTFKQVSLFTTLKAEDIFRESIREKEKLHKVFLLTQGKEFSLNKIDANEVAAKKLFLNLWFESPELVSLLGSYNSVFPRNSLFGFWGSILHTIYNNISGVSCYDVTLPAVYSQDVFEKFYREILLP